MSLRSVLEKFGKSKFIGQETFGLAMNIEQPIYFGGVPVAFDTLKSFE